MDTLAVFGMRESTTTFSSKFTGNYYLRFLFSTGRLMANIRWDAHEPFGIRTDSTQPVHW